jgi:hypothetical protein
MHNLDVHPDFYTQISKYMIEFEDHRIGYGLRFNKLKRFLLHRLPFMGTFAA